MKPLCILTVAGWAYPDAEGGSFRVVSEVAAGLARRGHNVHLLTSRADPALPEEEMIDGVHFHRYPVAAGRGFAFYRSVQKGVKASLTRLYPMLPFDAIHVHHLFSAHAVLAAADCYRAPVLYTCYMPYFLEHLDREAQRTRSGRPPLKARLMARALRRMDGRILHAAARVVVLSQFVRSLLEEYYPKCGGKVVEIPAGVDLARFAPGDRLAARRRIGLPPDATLVLTVRRLEARMGIESLLRAFAIIRAKRPDAVLAIAGRGSLDAELRRLAESLSISGAVRWLGFVPEADLPELYRAADLFVLPTRALEGFGLVTLEALACGVPAIGTDVGATAEILRPLDPELVIATPAPDDITASVLRFLARADRPALAERCRSYVEERYSWPPMIERYESLFLELVGGRVKGSPA